MPEVAHFREKFNYTNVTIESGDTVSGAADLSGKSLVGFYLPATMDGTAITFQIADEDGGTFIAVHDGAGAALSKTVAQNTFVPLNPADTAGWQHIKLVSGTTETADRVIKLVSRMIA